MSLLCKICTLPARTRKTVDAALLSGMSYRRVAAKYSTRTAKFSYVSVARHRTHLVPEQLRRQPPPPDAQVTSGVLERIEGVIGELRAIALSPQAKRVPGIAISALKEVLRGLESIGKITGEFPSGGINLNFGNGNFTEEQLAAFFDSLKKKPEKVALFLRLIDETFGPRRPVSHIHFTKSDGEGRPLLEAASL